MEEGKHAKQASLSLLQRGNKNSAIDTCTAACEVLYGIAEMAAGLCLLISGPYSIKRYYFASFHTSKGVRE